MRASDRLPALPVESWDRAVEWGKRKMKVQIRIFINAEVNRVRFSRSLPMLASL